jgi:hypothetical protein
MNSRAAVDSLLSVVASPRPGDGVEGGWTGSQQQILPFFRTIGYDAWKGEAGLRRSRHSCPEGQGEDRRNGTAVKPLKT